MPLTEAVDEVVADSAAGNHCHSDDYPVAPEKSPALAEEKDQIQNNQNANDGNDDYRQRITFKNTKRRTGILDVYNLEETSIQKHFPGEETSPD